MPLEGCEATVHYNCVFYLGKIAEVIFATKFTTAPQFVEQLAAGLLAELSVVRLNAALLSHGYRAGASLSRSDF